MSGLGQPYSSAEGDACRLRIQTTPRAKRGPVQGSYLSHASRPVVVWAALAPAGSSQPWPQEQQSGRNPMDDTGPDAFRQAGTSQGLG